eukprot:TRINITY_DN4811_c0_g1_i1.p1 TRINITY_DN4811_c0_g1~~TRINITY_DN4811_c0_g1_i1.p1  ORF type:complete len:731 (+),score=158.85 TRINITY_DN4811_c0_g1_i1:100-2193(+)
MGPHDRGGVVCHEGTDEYGGVVEVCRNSFDKPRFGFDGVFNEDCGQEQVYQTAAKPLLDEALLGHQCTLLCYGQSGSGKTHTLSSEDGITKKSLEYLFSSINPDTDTITLQCIQIYNEEIQDLTCPGLQQVFLRREQDGSTVLQGACFEECKDLNSSLAFVEGCKKNRSTALTRLNATSSRSHSCTIIRLRTELPDKSGVVSGTVTLVDLAGSERVSKTHSSGDRLQEAKFINQSLTHLGNVISCLISAKHAHIPYRDSTLTKLLQDSLGGSGKTSIIITLSPTPRSVWESLSTCQFGQRAMLVKTAPKVRREEDWKQKCQRLEKELASLNNESGYTKLVSDQFEAKTKNAQLTRTISELEDQLRAAHRQHKSDLLDREETIQQLQEDRSPEPVPTTTSTTQTEAEAPAVDYEELLNGLKEQIDKLTSAETRLTNTNTALQKDLNSKKAYIIELEKTLDRTETVLNHREADNSQLQKQVNSQTESMTNLSKELNEVKEAFSEELDNVVQEADGLRASKNKIKQRLTAATNNSKKEIEKLKSELESMHQSSMELKEIGQMQTHHLSQLKEEEDRWQEDRRRMQSQIESLNLVADKLAAQCATAEERLQKKEEECTSLINEVRFECSTRVRDAVNEMNSSESYIEAEQLRKEVKRLMRENRALSARVQDEVHKNKKLAAMKEQTEHRLALSLSQSLGLG